jgi:hypothetical protein
MLFFAHYLLHLRTAGFLADAHVAPVLQTMSGTLTVPAKISGISSVKNSGK